MAYSVKETSFSWNISYKKRELLNVFWKNGECFGSEFFSTYDNSWWQLILFPLGDAPFKSESVLRLCRQNTGKNVHVEGDIILKSSSGKELRFKMLKSLSKSETYIRIPLFRNVSEMKHRFNPSKNLIIKCKISVIEIFNEQFDSKSTYSLENENSFTHRNNSFDDYDYFSKSSAISSETDSEESNLHMEQDNETKLKYVEMPKSSSANAEMICCDITLISGEARVKAHKNVLSKQSLFFSEIFKNSSNDIICDMISGSALTEIVSYIYTGRFIDLSWEQAKDLYYAVNIFDLSELKIHCREFLIANLSLQNVVDTIIWCTKHNFEEIKQHAISFICSHFEDIKSTNNWSNLVKNHPSVCVEILSQAMENTFLIKK